MKAALGAEYNYLNELINWFVQFSIEINVQYRNPNCDLGNIFN